MGQQEIYNFLKANKDVWFNINQLEKFCNMRRCQLSKRMSKMFKYPGIFEGLEYKFEKEYRKSELAGNFHIKYFRVKL